jgi:hypothetical protein
MNGIQRARTFLLGAYHDLPNVLFIGALLLGAMVGFLPLVFVSLGMILNGAIIAVFQGILGFIFPTWSQVSMPAGSLACEVFGKLAGVRAPGTNLGVSLVAPSHWIGATVFFAAFNIYNSMRVMMKDPARGASADKVENRRAFSLSTLVIGLAFLLLVFARGFTGCETWLGASLGAIIGGVTAVMYWELLDTCGVGVIPDLLQVVGSLAPAGDGAEVPVVCSAPPPA